ncbi:hypothetical protein EI42_03161 [Thermosporothrix hazakensis]|uniref:Uncharacterized protein n=2 Tax=Thermosporothrix hazakensis TaxID=644383 RepID=A0A326U783_THEHA|nr:hypothetical protein EI42_03161 [Thermosporothrix hazakensis]GCE45187.1 hypothetical protein KTH_00560 [Thermosporothrix hazakensis]
MQDSHQSKLGIQALWTVKEKLWLPISRRWVWVPATRNKNTFTTHGITALASAIGGNYRPPVYLVIESLSSTLLATIPAGAMTIQVTEQIDQPGDTQIVIDPGGAAQEILEFSGVVVGSSGVVYTLTTPTTQPHDMGTRVTRHVRSTDTMSNILREVPYDPVYAPLQRIESVAGYSGGAGQYTIQFYLTAAMAQTYISHIGLSDSGEVGQGNLHNHCLLGYDHSGKNTDISIDGNVVISNI